MADRPPFSLSRMAQAPSFRRAVLLVGVGAAYYFGAKLGLQFAFINASATSVWPPTGIALAAFVLFGYRIWPAVAAAAFLANLENTGSVTPSLGIALGNTLEGLTAAYLVNRFARGGRVFDRVRDIIRFTALAGFVATTVSATIGVTSLALGGLAEWERFGHIWLTWWLGDAVGAIVLAPALILWGGVKPGVRWDRAKAIEGVSLFAVCVLASLAPFSAACFPTATTR